MHKRIFFIESQAFFYFLIISLIFKFFPAIFTLFFNLRFPEILGKVFAERGRCPNNNRIQII